jgi:hypothetical protein
LLWGPLSLLFNGWWCPLPGVKWSGHEFNHSSPSIAEIRNEWNYTSTTVYPYILDKIIITFYLFFIVKGIKDRREVFIVRFTFYLSKWRKLGYKINPLVQGDIYHND